MKRSKIADNAQDLTPFKSQVGLGGVNFVTSDRIGIDYTNAVNFHFPVLSHCRRKNITELWMVSTQNDILTKG